MALRSRSGALMSDNDRLHRYRESGRNIAAGGPGRLPAEAP
jgi:hypothetical protein